MKAKSRILRYFLHWLKSENVRFQHRVRVTRILKNSIEFNFYGITPAVHGSFGCGPNGCSSIDVGVDWDKHKWNLLIGLSLRVKWSSAGWYCGLCPPETVKCYPTREELFVSHTFAGFRSWCNETLSRSIFLEPHGVEEYRAKFNQFDDRSDFHKNLQFEHVGCICRQVNIIR
jgi:hypothetical protein